MYYEGREPTAREKRELADLAAVRLNGLRGAYGHLVPGPHAEDCCCARCLPLESA